MARPTVSSARSPAACRCSTSVVFLIFLGLALAVYFPALGGEYLWDDNGHITRPELRSGSGLFRIWFEIGATQQYYPLLHSAFWLEHKLWGDSVQGYHLVNVVLHTSAAILFWLVLRRLAVPGAWLAAALFLLHPVCVESVAWISEQKNTLSLTLYLAAALAYLSYDRGRAPRAYFVALSLFILALLTKTVTASLPAALLVVFWWQRGRLEWRRDFRPLLPWFVLGAGSGLLTAWFERKIIGAEGADFALGLLERSLLAGRVTWFYLGKLLWPVELSFMYPRWIISAGLWWQWLFPLAALGLLAGLFVWRKKSRGPLAIALLFVGSLFPVLGFFNVYPFIYSFVADHFQYLASLAVFAGAGSTLTAFVAHPRLPTRLRQAIPLIILSLLGVLTWFQSAMYRDADTLYRVTLQRNPKSWMAHNNLAILRVESNRAEEALPHYEAALGIRPGYAEGEYNYGFALNRLGRHAEALPHLDRAVTVRPNYAEAHNELGVALMGLGRSTEGLARFEKSISIYPSYGMARRNLGLALAAAGKVTEALPHFERAVQLLPDDLDARLQLATALITLSTPGDAIPHLEAALHLDPGSGQAHYQIAVALRSLGRFTEATQHYREAARLDPRFNR
jgi:protein O-mannosyl-transferase